MSKITKMERVAEAVLDLIQKHGLTSLTFSRVARAAKVSRPWIYKYLGNDREKLMEFAVDHYGKIFSQLDKKVPTESQEAWIESVVQGFRLTLKQIQRYPWIIPLFYRYRTSESALGVRIRYLENIFIEIMANEISKVFSAKRDEAYFLSEALTSMRIGWAYQFQCREVSEEALCSLLESILKSFEPHESILRLNSALHSQSLRAGGGSGEGLSSRMSK